MLSIQQNPDLLGLLGEEIRPGKSRDPDHQGTVNRGFTVLVYTVLSSIQVYTAAFNIIQFSHEYSATKTRPHKAANHTAVYRAPCWGHLSRHFLFRHTSTLSEHSN